MGMNQHTQGTAINNLVHGIHLLSGHWGRPGDGPQSLTGQPSACGTVREVGTLSHALPGDLRVDDPRAGREGREALEPARRVASTRRSATTPCRCGRSSARRADQGGDIDTIWVQVTNPGQTLPNLHKLFDAKARLAGQVPDRLGRLPDGDDRARRPGSALGDVGREERHRTATPSGARSSGSRWSNPPGEARDDCWQTIAVARKLFDLGHPGMKDKDGKFLFHIADDGRQGGRGLEVGELLRQGQRRREALRGVPRVHAHQAQGRGAVRGAGRRPAGCAGRS